ncbi:MAG: hypothetical protein AB1411_09465 [Nitrospirota bacterium]
MTTTTTNHLSSPEPRRCSECGRQAWETATVVDPTTGSQLALCGQCVIVLLQRQHFPPGCGGG